ncbi:mycothiol system anti-sigma-R factor [Mycobacterium sp. SM1]|uniref:mycothiol system anti-sigma-R factor n=1 Tax=Mycobacterium sp. SM1 TaxID=2816243 RepID=UPI001BCB29F0|nr:mycothiol system anti-sigma-R factor [Mycobacterium sp. SM1]MBS4729072.1 mycothiol system anti-sigma-R factor [Mycobacterium sp. SM1]
MTESSSARDPSERSGHPGGSDFSVDCAQVIAEIWALLDGECTPDTRKKLRQHLQACPECLRYYGLEERIKALISKKCRGEKAPERLRERLRLEIRRTTIIRDQQPF